VGEDKETKQRSLQGRLWLSGNAVHMVHKFSWFTSLPEGKSWNRVLNYRSCLLQSLLTNHPFIEHSVILVTERLWAQPRINQGDFLFMEPFVARFKPRRLFLWQYSSMIKCCWFQRGNTAQDIFSLHTNSTSCATEFHC
jgi:hypothetical protein